MRIGVRREISGGNGPIGRDGRLRLVLIIISSFVLLTDFSSLGYIRFHFWRSFVGFIYFYLQDTFGALFWFDFLYSRVQRFMAYFDCVLHGKHREGFFVSERI